MAPLNDCTIAISSAIMIQLPPIQFHVKVVGLGWELYCMVGRDSTVFGTVAHACVNNFIAVLNVLVWK